MTNEEAIALQRELQHKFMLEQGFAVLPQEYRDKIHQLADEIEWPEFTDDLDFFDAHTEIES